MIVLASKDGNVNTIHIVVGPDTDLAMDIEGHADADLTAILKAIGVDAVAVLRLTRCRNETETASALAAAAIPYMESKVRSEPAPASPDINTILTRKAP